MQDLPQELIEETLRRLNWPDAARASLACESFDEILPKVHGSAMALENVPRQIQPGLWYNDFEWSIAGHPEEAVPNLWAEIDVANYDPGSHTHPFGELSALFASAETELRVSIVSRLGTGDAESMLKAVGRAVAESFGGDILRVFVNVGEIRTEARFARPAGDRGWETFGLGTKTRIDIVETRSDE